jgi:hypothetical protein
MISFFSNIVLPAAARPVCAGSTVAVPRSAVVIIAIAAASWIPAAGAVPAGLTGSAVLFLNDYLIVILVMVVYEQCEQL